MSLLQLYGLASLRESGAFKTHAIVTIASLDKRDDPVDDPDQCAGIQGQHIADRRAFMM